MADVIEITAEVRERELRLTSIPMMPSGSRNHLWIRITFDSEWEGTTKTLVAYRDLSKPYHVPLGLDDMALIPHEVLAKHGVVYLGVFGVAGDQRVTSTIVRYGVNEGALTEGLQPSDPTPEMWDQLISAVNEMRQAAESAMRDAQTAAQGAQWSAQDAAGSAKQAEGAATRAETATDTATTAAGNAETAKTDAQTAQLAAAQSAADAQQAANRAERNIHELLQEIDNLLETTVVKSGDTMTGSLDLGGNDLQNVGTAQLQVLALLPPNDPDGELGVNAYAEAAILGEDGHPTGQVLSFYGIFNDEPAVLRNVHDPVMDTDAVPKGYLERRLEDFGGTGGGEAGGYYTPAVSQPEAGSMEISFDASSGEMPEVAPVLVALPQGEKGDTGPQGEKGNPGKDGVSATHKWSGTTLTITSASGTSSANLKGDKGEPGEKGADGAKGDKGDPGEPGQKGDKGDQGIQGAQGEQGPKGDKGDKGDTGANGTNGSNGVSCTHSWNGTTLSVTSASGTSSANLKGEKGDKGDPGEQGIQGPKGDTGEQGPAGADGAKGDTGDTGAQGPAGPAGKTPEKGVDYFTDEDKSAMVSDVLAALPTWNGGSY